MEKIQPVDLSKVIEQHKKWLDQPYPTKGKVVWNKRNNTIELYVYDSGHCSEIDLDRYQTKEDLLDWIFHLTEKTWYNEVAYDLLMMFEEVIPDKILFR